ncbi:hypothetical protein CPB84DRAFT_570596 [Gymnopilus junonius]|uniref:Uncharacterized protein n=1 Tax=Gymnopilus junonius TaxID=109634 RepID=A0A9P5TH74_GYMJU|nr:hypothetical protein CPB84DRAFT_570596 [Gymnopilus junonius]
MAASNRLPRRNSLRLPPQPPAIPIPPSLKQSPYLTAPIFNREVSPILPSEEDEKWLQDTIPIASPTSPSATFSIRRGSTQEYLGRRANVIQPSSTESTSLLVPSMPYSRPSSSCSDYPSSTLSLNESRLQTRYLGHSLLPSAEGLSPTAPRAIHLKQSVSDPNVSQLPRRSGQDYFSGASPAIRDG